MVNVLKLYFDTDEKVRIISIKNPKADLSREAVQEAMETIVLWSKKSRFTAALKKAKIKPQPISRLGYHFVVALKGSVIRARFNELLILFQATAFCFHNPAMREKSDLQKQCFLRHEIA